MAGDKPEWRSDEEHALYLEWENLKHTRRLIEQELSDIQHARHQGYLKEEALSEDAAHIDKAIAEIREELGEI